MKVKGISGSLVRWLLFAYCTAGVALMGCSGDEQETEDPVEESGEEGEYEEEGYADEEGYEEEGTDYSEEVEETAQEILDEAEGSADDAEEQSETALESIMNSGPTEEVAEGETEYEETYEEEEMPADAGADAAEEMVDAAPGLGGGSALESLKSPGGAADTSGTEIGTPMQEVGETAPMTIPDGTNAVMYVQVSRANVRQGPGTDNAVVGSLVKGDTVVATIEGDWAKTSTGTYVSASLLTLRAVGRTRRAGSWASQR